MEDTWSTWATNGIKAVGSGLQWVWESTPLSRLVTGTATYTTNTIFQILEQIVALRKAVPSIIYNEKSRDILNSMTHIAVQDVLPILALNGLNNQAQTYFREQIEKQMEENPAWFAAYTVALSALTLANYGVRAFTIRQGVQSFIQITVVDSMAPLAFNADKNQPPLTYCEEVACNTKRKMKGLIREPIILLANDALVSSISSVPYIGKISSDVLRVYFNGRYIARSVTPELCERHKFQELMSEFILGLGLTYELSSYLLDKALESTVGIPPFFYYRTLRHLIMLLHINLAAHLSLPVVKPKEATLIIDPLNVYEWICRFLADVLFSGLMERAPLDFKPEKDAKPFFPLSPTLKYGTSLLNKDLALYVEPKYFDKTLNRLNKLILPPMMQDVNGLINDPIIAKYWPTIQQGTIFSLDLVKSAGKGKITGVIVGVFASVSERTSTVLYYITGIPEDVTRCVLMLSQEKDFWDFIDAMRSWFVRHHLKCTVDIVGDANHGIHNTNLVEEPQLEADEQFAISATELRPAITAAEDNAVSGIDLRPHRDPPLAVVLVPEEKEEPPKVSIASNPVSLFSTRKRGQIDTMEGSTSTLKQRTPLPEVMNAFS